MMLSLVEFEPRAVVQPHSHPHEQMGMLLEGELTFTIGGETQDAAAGRDVADSRRRRAQRGRRRQAREGAGCVSSDSGGLPVRSEW